MFLNPQIDADMTRIGCRVCAMENCNLCGGCYNNRQCIHLTRWKRKKAEMKEQRRKKHQALKKYYKNLSPEQRELEHAEDVRRGGYRECESGYRSDGATCFRDLHCDTHCSGDWRPWTWRCDTSCSGPDMYGKYDDEFKGAFQKIGEFFNNLPNVIMDVFKPDGPLAHVFDPNLNGVADGLRKAGDAIKSGLENAFDPEKNGVGAAIRKFGADIEGGFEAMGKTLTDAFSKESMDRAFGPMVAAFNSFGESMNEYFKDPANILGFVTMCMSTIAAALPPPFSAPLSILASCTQMIGSACLGKPFDPMDLLDLGMALTSPQAKLAKNIATTTVKATTIVGKLAKGASAATKSVMASAKEGVKKMAAMSAKDKALLAGKTLAKITMKLGTDVISKNPVESQQTPAQRQEDESIGDDWLADSQDPQRQVNSDALDAELAKEEYQEALKQERDAGTITGEYKGPRNAAKTAKKEVFVNDEVNPSLAEQTQRATIKPRSYIVDEKIYFYKNSTQEARERQIQQEAKATAEAKVQKILDEARLEKGKTEKQVRDDARLAERQEFKSENEKRKYGFTYEEAKERLKLYKVEQDKFATATGTVPKKDLHPPKRKGGITLIDAPPPEFMMSDEENRGEGDFGQSPYLLPITTPTFFHFVKGKFAKIPELSDPENWFPEFNKFWNCYNKQKVNYQKLIDANKIALEARRNMSMAEKDRAYQEWLASDVAASSPLQLAIDAKAQGHAAFKSFIENLGFDIHSWNNQMKIVKREDLMIDVEPVVPRDPPPKPQIPSSDKVFKVPDADPEEFPDPELQGGAVSTSLLEPDRKDAIAYYKYKLTTADPFHVYGVNEILQAYERDWEMKPQETIAAINQYKLSPPPPTVEFSGKGRKRRLTHFFGLRGGSDDWDIPEASGQVSQSEIDKVKSSKHMEIVNTLDQEAREQIAQELWETDLPQALQEYLAASPAEKREKRGIVQAYRTWGQEEYGDPQDSDTWYMSRQSFEDDVKQKAPELNNEGEDAQIPQMAFENTDEGKADVAIHAESSKAARDAKMAEESAQKAATEFEALSAEEVKLYNDWKKTFDEEWKAAQTEDEKSLAIEKFNGHFPEGDKRRLSGSGKPQPTLIFKNLWLGNMDDAKNKQWLKRHKIHTIFNVTPDVKATPGFKTIRFSIHDSKDDEIDMLEHGLYWAEQILEAMESGPVLVHCKEGRQRSATLVALIMGLKSPQKLHLIIKKLRAKRPIALMPFPTFARCLKKWFV
jgi:hypothetical protein